jgi:hypothetical protein
VSQAEPWSIFTQGGGDGAAVTWAQDLLQELGAPVTAGNEQFIYDWEKSEGGGGQYNPLNQGPVPGQPQLTFTGSQYGGGAAGYVSVAAGLQGAVDYLNMPAYAGVKAGLLANQPAAAEQALIASPWAGSHYGGGADFSQVPLPGTTGTAIDTSALTSGLADVGGATGAAASAALGATGLSGDVTNIFSGLLAPFESWALRMFIGLAGAALVVAALILAGKASGTVEHPGRDATMAALAPVGE